jgi:hypothetical protein
VRFRASGTVRVVEDQEEVRTLMKAVLESEGFNVLTAAGGDAALSLARWYSETIHLLITDVITPDMTGKQVADQLVLMRPGIKGIQRRCPRPARRAGARCCVPAKTLYLRDLVRQSARDPRLRGDSSQP